MGSLIRCDPVDVLEMASEKGAVKMIFNYTESKFKKWVEQYEV